MHICFYVMYMYGKVYTAHIYMYIMYIHGYVSIHLHMVVAVVVQVAVIARAGASSCSQQPPTLLQFM